ncbi:hypothetical protein M569_13826 [Genlisea aurea]|uniref:Uncharacterized protein n=1 Tax=Genlisea aurea TaxID=192259 RepID=S8C2U3_9LAMI|nr:hypothetical protein M569_13826 [Genlisea aurea]
MAEEHGFQATDGHRMCVNNCGFLGNPAKQNLCSKCYTVLCLEKSGDSPIFTPALSFSLEKSTAESVSPTQIDEKSATATSHALPSSRGGRCSACRKKVGLFGFTCRCGASFCGTHRYPEKHGCSFDFKAAGRDAIAKANPVVKGEKLRKI